MKLPILSSKELCKFLENEGFKAIRQKGSHRFYQHTDGRTTLAPISSKSISRGLLGAVLDEINMDREIFLKKHYKKQ